MDFSNVASTVIQKTYQDDALVRKMIAEQKDMKVPYELIPSVQNAERRLKLISVMPKKEWSSQQISLHKKSAMMRF